VTVWAMAGANCRDNGFTNVFLSNKIPNHGAFQTMHAPAASWSLDLLVRRVLAALLLALILLASAQLADAQQAPQRLDNAQQDTPTKAIDYGDFYYKRLAVHRAGSYAILPLFAAQYFLGDKLIEGGAATWVKPTHQVVAATIGGIFVVNTVTGVWNLVESRKDPERRSQRFIHAALMLGANAGFVYTGLVASKDASDLASGADRHRNAALVSIGVATTGTVLMWLWND
jgi:hypothetical protein